MRNAVCLRNSGSDFCSYQEMSDLLISLCILKPTFSGFLQMPFRSESSSNGEVVLKIFYPIFLFLCRVKVKCKAFLGVWSAQGLLFPVSVLPLNKCPNQSHQEMDNLSAFVFLFIMYRYDFCNDSWKLFLSIRTDTNLSNASASLPPLPSPMQEHFWCTVCHCCIIWSQVLVSVLASYLVLWNTKNELKVGKKANV